MTDPRRARVLCVSGDSGAGKTTLIRRLLARLPRPADQIGVVKHTHHAIDWHPRGTDSAVLWGSGPAALAVAGPDQTAVFEPAGPAGPGAGGDGASAVGGDRAEAGAAAGATTGAGSGRAGAATRRLEAVCRRLPKEIRLVLAEGFRDARAPTVWTAAGPPADGPPPPGAVAVVVPAEHRTAWEEGPGDAEVFAREDVAEIAARVEGWSVPVGELAEA